MNEKCNCYMVLGLPREKVIVHLTGCEEDYQTEEYDALPWYRKLVAFNPRKFHNLHRLDV